MRVKESNDFKPEFPEQFQWGFVDSPKLTSIASALASRIRNELSAPANARVNVPGLRMALNVIADVAEF